jgi:hypothetical protein
MNSKPIQSWLCLTELLESHSHGAWLFPAKADLPAELQPKIPADATDRSMNAKDFESEANSLNGLWWKLVTMWRRPCAFWSYPPATGVDSYAKGL